MFCQQNSLTEAKKKMKYIYEKRSAIATNIQSTTQERVQVRRMNTPHTKPCKCGHLKTMQRKNMNFYIRRTITLNAQVWTVTRRLRKSFSEAWHEQGCMQKKKVIQHVPNKIMHKNKSTKTKRNETHILQTAKQMYRQHCFWVLSLAFASRYQRSPSWSHHRRKIKQMSRTNVFSFFFWCQCLSSSKECIKAHLVWLHTHSNFEFAKRIIMGGGYVICLSFPFLDHVHLLSTLERYKNKDLRNSVALALGVK